MDAMVHAHTVSADVTRARTLNQSKDGLTALVFVREFP
jgi:hypothetical protein